MAARSPRLRFSTPFVITIAAAVPLTAACVVRSSSPPDHANPPGPHTNPPGPTAHNEHDHEGHSGGRPPTQNPPGTGTSTQNPPTQNPPTQNPPTQNPPTQEPTWNPPPPTSNLPTNAATWTVTKGKGDDTCRAAMPVNCPKPQTPGGAVPTCNPPPPMNFACPPQMASNGKVTVTRKEGETDCTVDAYFPECPANAKCAMKPSYRTACPTR